MPDKATFKQKTKQKNLSGPGKIGSILDARFYEGKI